MDYGTAYVGDWKLHDFVESAEYESPRGIDPERQGVAVKVKLDDAINTIAGQGSLLSYSDTVRGAVAWTPDEPTLDLAIDGVLLLETSGRFVIRAAQKSRFGSWTLTVEPLREDGNPDA
jgi:hypothetical protein